MEIIPSIFTRDPEELREMLALSKDAGIKKVQFDINDGTFLGNHSLKPDFLSVVETNLFFDFHLMTSEPIGWVEKCVFKNTHFVIGQIEKMSNQKAFIGKVAQARIKPGLALDIETAIDLIDPSLFSELEVVLVMAYPAGVGGQKFDFRVIPKIERLKEIKSQRGAGFQILCDGGINPATIKYVADAGCEGVVIGRSLFVGSIHNNIKKLLENI